MYFFFFFFCKLPQKKKKISCRPLLYSPFHTGSWRWWMHCGRQMYKLHLSYCWLLGDRNIQETGLVIFLATAFMRLTFCRRKALASHLLMKRGEIEQRLLIIHSKFTDFRLFHAEDSARTGPMLIPRWVKRSVWRRTVERRKYFILFFFTVTTTYSVLCTVLIPTCHGQADCGQSAQQLDQHVVFTWSLCRWI